MLSDGSVKFIFCSPASTDGAAYCMGRMNSDCWYVGPNLMEVLFYIRFLFKLAVVIFRNYFVLLYRYLYTLDFPESRVINQPDQTLEILMSELDPAVMDQFYMKDGVTAKDVTRVSIFNNNSVSCLAAKYFGSFSYFFSRFLNQSLAFFPGEWNS